MHKALDMNALWFCDSYPPKINFFFIRRVKDFFKPLFRILSNMNEVPPLNRYSQ